MAKYKLTGREDFTGKLAYHDVDKGIVVVPDSAEPDGSYMIREYYGAVKIEAEVVKPVVTPKAVEPQAKPNTAVKSSEKLK